jgi:hypothetical protein
MHVSVHAECLPPAIHLEFRPNARLISSTGRFVEEFYGGVLADPDATSRVVLTIHELLENIAKYSSDGLSHLVVQLLDRDGKNFVQIRTRNTSPPSRLAELRRLLDQVSRSEDPVALYNRLIAESAEEPDRSGLGLARIRAEGEMDLDYAVRGNEVTILAQAPVEIVPRP